MKINQFLKQFAQHYGISEADARAIKIDKFGDSPQMADELLVPVLSGIKTATCSALWEWQYDNEAIPYVGMLSVILNGKDEPACIIETTEVNIKNYNEVDGQFASDEGEGNRSLAYWREAHEGFFTRTLPRIGKQFSEDMPIVCERFKVIYKP